MGHHWLYGPDGKRNGCMTVGNMSDAPQTSREWQKELSACKAENQALAEALQACLPLVDDAMADAKLKQDVNWEAGLTKSSDGWSHVVQCFRLQAEHIRSLLGLPQP